MVSFLCGKGKKLDRQAATLAASLAGFYQKRAVRDTRTRRSGDTGHDSHNRDTPNDAKKEIPVMEIRAFFP